MRGVDVGVATTGGFMLAALGKAKRSGQKHSSSGTASVAPSGSSVVTNDDSPGQLQRSGSSKSSSIPPLEFMIAFSNEAGVSGYCCSGGVVVFMEVVFSLWLVFAQLRLMI